MPRARLVPVAAFVAALTLSVLPAVAPAAPAPGRIAGADPTATSAAASAAGWGSARRVVVAGVFSWPDALAATALGAPVLHTAPDVLSSDVAGEIRRLGASEAVVVGGQVAVSSRVRSQLRGLGVNLTEVSGYDRYDTAARVAALVPASPHAVVVSGESWPDAVSIAPWAAASGVPIYLTRRDDLPSSSQRARSASHVVVVGGAAVISDRVVSSLPNPERLAGGDRHDTSALVAQWSAAHGMTIAGAVVVPGGSAAEAIVGGALGGTWRAPALLAPGGRLNLESQKFVVRASWQMTRLAAVGPVPDASLADAYASAQSADVLSWVNDHRHANGLSSVSPDGAMVERALGHVQSMMGVRRLFHQQPQCGNWAEVVGQASDARSVWNLWMASPSHRQALLNTGVRMAGTAVLTDAYGRRWAAVVLCG